LLIIAYKPAHAAVFDVSSVAQFQAALNTAQANGENDTINVLPCSSGCSTNPSYPVPVYDLDAPLTYTAAATENQSLLISGFDSDTRILDGVLDAPILRIDTTAANADFAAQITIQGLTFTRGAARFSPILNGGAVSVLAKQAGIRVEGSVFEGNSAVEDGGALYIFRTGPAEFPILITDVTFDDNEAGFGASPGGDGGAAYIAASAGSQVTIVNVDFLNGRASDDGGCLVVEGLPEAEPVGLVSLVETYFGACLAQSDGGGAYMRAYRTTLDRAGFIGNATTSGNGGGLHVELGWTDLSIVNSGFAYNSANGRGGGLLVAPPSIGGAGFANITNNTLYENTADRDGGNAAVAISGSTGYMNLYNNIIWGGTSGDGNGSDIYIDNDPIEDISASVAFYNNNLTSLSGFPDSSPVFWVRDSDALTSDGNIEGQPNLELDINDPIPSPRQVFPSITIDAGRNGGVGPGVVIPVQDFEGDPRPSTEGGVVDIGMDEYVGEAPPTADLAVTATATPDPVTALENVSYAVTVANLGPDAATNLSMTAALASGMTFVSATPSQGSCSHAGAPVIVNCALGTVANGDDVTLTIVATAPAVMENASLVSTFSVASEETDPDAQNDSVTITTTVVPAGPVQADLAVTKNSAPDPVFSNAGNLTYTVTVQNNGPATATNVTLSDQLPIDDVDFVSAAASNGGTCGLPDGLGELVCQLGELAVNSNATVTVVVTPDAVEGPTVIENTASVSGAEEDPTPGNNTSTEQTTVNPATSDLSISLTTSPAEPSIDELLTYTVAVTNKGPSDSFVVNVQVKPPAQGTLESFDIEKGECELIEGVVDCAIGAMSAGSTVTAEIVIRTPGEAATLVAKAIVSGDADDPDEANNEATSTVQVIDTVKLVIKGKGGGKSSAIGWLELTLGAALVLLARFLSRFRATRGGMATWLVVCLVVGLPFAPHRAEADDWYLGAALGEASADYSSGDLRGDLAARDWSISEVSVDDTDTAWKIYVGYQLTDLIALELGYADLGEVETRYTTDIPPNQIDAILQDTYDVHPYLGDGFTAGGALRWPLGDRFFLTARAGVFAWQADIEVKVVSGGQGRVDGDDDGVDLYYGIGAEWRAWRSLGITLEWERYKLDDWVDVPTAGLRYSF